MKRKNIGIVGLFLVACVLMTAHPVGAQMPEVEFRYDPATTLILPSEQHQGLSQEDYRRRSFESPVEPRFKAVEFLKQAPPAYTAERVERLLHGITIDIPPEYDYYGHEIRRYMKNILTPEELGDALKLPEKINNAKRARIILGYWEKYLNSEINALRTEVEAANVPSKTKIDFRFNEAKINEFIPQVYGWIDRNIEFLEFLQENRGSYRVRYPMYQIENALVREKFLELYNKREDGRLRIVQYSPFRMMIY